MEEMKLRIVNVNGIKMHIAEKGEGPVVFFLHGFPELWYSWRHQILELSNLGYRAVAPDLRGFGDTDAPSSISSYTFFHIVGDIIALIDNFLGVEQVFLVAHDWGAVIAWHLCLFRPEKVKAFISLGVIFRPRNPKRKATEELSVAFGDNHYVCRFQEPGKMEAVFVRIGFAEVFLAKGKPGFELPPMLEENATIGNTSLENPLKLPSWLSKEDRNFYASKFDQTGFTGGLN